MRKLVIDVAPGDYAVCKLNDGAEVPTGLFAAGSGALVSVTSAPGEVSVICPADLAPADAEVEAGWWRLTVRGPLAFTLTGIIAALSSELAAAGVALFTLSTFDTDHILVKGDDLARAAGALRAAGHDVRD